MSYIQSAAVGLVLSCLYFYFLREAKQFSDHRVILSDKIDDVYDYVIVGGGSAGSVLASRLSEEKSNKVLLLEAGGFYDEHPNFHSLIDWPTLQKTEFDWTYYTEPQTNSCLGLKENRGYWPRGKVLGGSGILNAAQYTRGSRYDYDEWAEKGCKGWSYKDVLPYFLKSEDINIEELKSSKYHHIGGPMAVSGAGVTPLADLYLKAGKELGYNITDYNGEKQDGFSKIQLNLQKGVRVSSAVAFLGNVGKRNNLDIAINTFVTKVDIKDKKAVGVYYIRNGRKGYVQASDEVILSSGVINSPQLLMLSGIGPQEDLQKLNIPVLADLPVGKYLQDHLAFWLFSKINQSLSITPQVLSSFKTRLQYKLFGTGPRSIAFTDGSAFFKFDDRDKVKKYPDMQVLLVSALLSIDNNNMKDEYRKDYQPGNAEGFTWVISATHPRSRGTLRLRTSDPFDHPLIDPRYFADKRDIDDFISGIRIWEKFLETPTMKGLGVDIKDMKMSFCSKHEFRSDKYWECMLRHLAVTVYHPCCTNKMGDTNDPTAVVDTELRVKGIKGLRVVDGSVFPQIISGNTNAPIIMIAEKAADIIRGIDTVKDLREHLPTNL